MKNSFWSYLPAILELYQVQSESRAFVKCTKGPESRIKVISFYLFIVFRSNIGLFFIKPRGQNGDKACQEELLAGD
ncbi:MAG: hypothetical protein BGO39_22505 [Chloroflexi bacterium 54-19]|nr:MAG: hypothetical protein BGO39_22505 [Chloroflexi bacterium 54-19]